MWLSTSMQFVRSIFWDKLKDNTDFFFFTNFLVLIKKLTKTIKVLKTKKYIYVIIP